MKNKDGWNGELTGLYKIHIYVHISIDAKYCLTGKSLQDIFLNINVISDISMTDQMVMVENLKGIKKAISIL